MIKAVLVDDERPALRELDFLLKKHPEILVAGMYLNPLEAIEEIGRLKPQVVFLDINMPQLMGVDAASRILDVSPDTDIVFVTAFDQYAIEAFELHALDYILKPVDPKRLEKTIGRILEKRPVPQQDGVRKLLIKSLGRFKVAWENEEPIRWRAEKIRELFAFLLYHQGRDITKEELMDKLWAEYDPEKAIRQLYNGVYHIRKALGEYGIDRNLVSINSNYHLHLGPVDYDIKRFDGLGKSRDAGSFEILKEMEALYRGEYLEGEDYPWCCFERERLEKAYLRCLTELAKRYMAEGQYAEAEDELIKAYLKNPYEEAVTELLLKLYAATKEKSKAVRHFHAYSKLIREELGIKPDEKLAALCPSETA